MGFSRQSPASYRNRPRQRMPFPHISGSLPSPLKMRMRAWAFLEGSARINPSAPTPKRRAHSRFAKFSG